MRILQGKWQGRTIPFPTGAPTRPLTEKAREALFNILTHRWSLQGKEAIDLFAGSGSVGLEFLSRGAAHVTFVEKDLRAITSLRQLLTQWNALSCATLLPTNVETFLQSTPKPADFIFAGPPFRYWHKRRLITLILQKGWLKPGGCFILEHPLYESYADMPGFWREEKYVASRLSFFLG
ncbi:MAG: 16S rRNA (guanine(966)-N(2))-methyltransferase RsmD [Bacteroidia bacterium]|nr:16S rRNA (guanine(966)-N(2))-methyltransferase RsmD [Bacteroidia bacterium]GIV23964.1 MAG: methyltransferase [Bacteroidia bacterium]